MTLRLAVSNLWKQYDGNQVLRDCSFAFNENGIYVLTGPNGSGKSTFLRICALIETPDSGQISYFSNGNLAQKNLDLKRRITLVLPMVGVFNATVFKNIAYGLKIRGIKGSECEKKVINVLDFVGLSHKKEQNALTLSSGETQRLGIARALVIDPEILFLDEPTASIDSKNTEIVENIIRKMNGAGTTIIMTTHDASQAERLAGKILFMNEGAFRG